MLSVGLYVDDDARVPCTDGVYICTASHYAKVNRLTSVVVVWVAEGGR
jgi:hypothetical protein